METPPATTPLPAVPHTCTPAKTDPNCESCGGTGWIGDLHCPACNGPS
ncbi:DnaJ-class molecular chaperone [Streptomyces sp. V3I8]|nr:hypothetical protein [Streptomyces sp. V3I8]MDQ1041481.1 DnaJ-class molecular chaperone [Streptomyces sp. V3I8]